MSRRFLVCMALAWAVAGGGSAGLVAQASTLISETAAARLGLTRPWFAQLALAQAGARITDIVLSEGVLFVQSDTAMVQAIDAETGKTLWARQIGRSSYPSLTPSANHHFLVVVNGSTMYAVNRQTGVLLLEKVLDGSPCVGVAASATRAYVPIAGGVIAAHRLDHLLGQPPASGTALSGSTSTDKVASKSAASGGPSSRGAKAGAAKSAGTKSLPTKSETAPSESENYEGEPSNEPSSQSTQPETSSDPDPVATAWAKWVQVKPLVCHSIGQVSAQPLVTRETPKDEFLAWCDDRGHLNIGQLDRTGEAGFELTYRLATESPITCPAAYQPPKANVPGASGIIFVGSMNGYVHAIQEKDGRALWRYATGETIVQSPVSIDDRLYVATEHGGMYCLDAVHGSPIWLAPGAVQFVSASRSRVYAVDPYGRLLILNAASGARLGVMDTEDIPVKLVNDDTDRLYLADPRGLIQCLHEIDQPQPLIHLVHHQQITPVEEQAASEARKAPQPKPAKKQPAAGKTKAAEKPAVERPAAKPRPAAKATKAAPRGRPARGRAAKKAAADAGF